MMKSKLEPYKEEIAQMIVEGSSYPQIVDAMYFNHGLDTSEPAICNFVRKNHLRETSIKDLPVCNQCEHYTEVGTTYIQDRCTNVRVCKACMEVIPNYTRISPKWCCKRKGDLSNG